MNQSPEEVARDKIDKQLLACGWKIQNKNENVPYLGRAMISWCRMDFKRKVKI